MLTTKKKGKEGTKGAKQIVKENEETLSFYRNMVFGVNAVYFLFMVALTSFSGVDITFIIFASACYIGSYQFMVYMAKVKYGEGGALVDSGLDLNMEGGIGEHTKDLIILTAICQILSLYSSYFWLIWLFAPARGFWLLWKNVLGPYFMQEAPETTEVDEKKQKKKERKMKRQYQQ